MAPKKKVWKIHILKAMRSPAVKKLKLFIYLTILEMTRKPFSTSQNVYYELQGEHYIFCSKCHFV